MISADDFYGSPTWDDAAQAEFAQRIRRVPKGGARARRFEDKAWALFYRSNQRERQLAAIALLERGVVEAQGTPSTQALLLERAAFYQVKLGLRQTAIGTLRRVIELAPYGKRERIGVLAPELLLARLLVETRQHDDARALLDRYYRERRLPPPFATLAIAEAQDATGATLTDPELAAEIVVAKFRVADPPEPAVPLIVDATRDSLVALDRHFALEKESLELRYAPSSYPASYLAQTFLPALGAYLGRVLTRTTNATWRSAAPLMRSRIVSTDGSGARDPFAAAYERIYYGMPLAELYDALAAAPASGA